MKVFEITKDQLHTFFEPEHHRERLVAFIVEHIDEIRDMKFNFKLEGVDGAMEELLQDEVDALEKAVKDILQIVKDNNLEAIHLEEKTNDQ